MARFEIRALLPGDEDQLHRVARHLNSVNLPNDRGRIEEIVEHSYRSFAEVITSKAEREFVFVLMDLEKDQIIGTSMVLAQLGRRGAPYIYFDVIEEERYSATIDRHFHHTNLKIGYSYDGPTEIGGLVMDPSYRTSSERLGTMISYVRFLYIAAHPASFKNEIVAELLPPLEADGTSHLWEAVGRKFTTMSYAEADVLSKKNKEFIKGLFPEGAICATLLPKDAQDVIGKVGAQTKGVEKLLRRIGFRYAHRVDPFDGGPHFAATVDEIGPIRDTVRTKDWTILPPKVEGAEDEGAASFRRRSLVAVEFEVPPFFRAVPGDALLPMPSQRGSRGVVSGPPAISEDVVKHLDLSPGREILILPLS